ncbi:MAG TPA: hypothetical protein VEG38_06205, partial [Acidimicrobiia bacterium]|nr:hypothetical protein [Acidimicrobiia bacterium]
MKRLVVALASVLAGLMIGSTVAFGLGGQPVKDAPEVGAPRQNAPVVSPAVRPVPTPAPVSDVPERVGPVLDGVLQPLGLGQKPDRGPSGPVTAHTAATWADFVAEQLKQAPGSPFPGLAAGAHAGYGTGTAYATDADLSGLGTAIEVAFSGVTYGSSPLPARVDELQRSVAPALAAAQGFGRGSATEIGSGEDRVVLDDDSEAKAPPPSDGQSKELTDVDLVPVVNADLLQSRASARSASNGCVVGSDVALGQGVATRTDLVNEENKDARDRPILSLSEDEPERAATQSLSRIGLVPTGNAQPARFGLVSETRQTIAPITLFKGRPQEMTIEIGGEWILRAVADGTKGFISYGPEVDPGTPILRIDQKDGQDIALTLQDLQDDKGTDLGAPGVEEFIIGEDPRAIGGRADTRPIVTGTLAAAAVDILRVRIPDDEQPDGVLDVRVGHMEVAAAVPAGGISCPGIGMAKESSRVAVAPGERFTWSITVGNPNDCVLDKVKIVDTITASAGVR